MINEKLAKQRQEAILKILNFIQNGGELEEAKMFQAAFDQVDVAEIGSWKKLIAQDLIEDSKKD